MAKVYYETDGDLKRLAGKTIAIIGYGSQGHAHALNLRDSGVKVIVGLPASSQSRQKVSAQKLEVFEPAEAARRGDVIVVLIPDPVQPQVYKEAIAPNLGAGKALLFAHGFNIHFKFVVPPPSVDVIMIAPKSPGHRMRELFQEGIGVPALLAVGQEAPGHAQQTAPAYAQRGAWPEAGVIRPRVDGRKRQGAETVPRDAIQGRRAPDREGRDRAAKNDGLDETGRRGGDSGPGSGAALVEKGSRPGEPEARSLASREVSLRGRRSSHFQHENIH